MFEYFQSAAFVEEVDYLIRNLPFNLWETIYTTFLATAFAYIAGLPTGVILTIGTQGGIHPYPKNFMRILNTIINLLRSVPFLILMVLVIPLSRLIVGTSVGTVASVIPLSIAAFPFVARLVESSLQEIDKGVIEAAQSMGCTTMQIVSKVMLPESAPSLLNGLTTATITILSYGAMAGAIGAGGLGNMALNYGFQRRHLFAMWVSVIVLVVLVQILQGLGTAISRKCDKRTFNSKKQ